MRRFFGALLVVSAATLAAQGHALFLVPDAADPGKAVVVFGHELAPEPVRDGTWKKFAGLKLTAIDGAGKTTELKFTEAKDHLAVAVPAGTRVISGQVDYGVFAKEGAKPKLVRYYPKAILGAAAGRQGRRWSTRRAWRSCRSGGRQDRFRVVMAGKPVAGAKVEVMLPEKKGEEGRGDHRRGRPDAGLRGGRPVRGDGPRRGAEGRRGERPEVRGRRPHRDAGRGREVTVSREASAGGAAASADASRLTGSVPPHTLPPSARSRAHDRHLARRLPRRLHAVPRRPVARRRRDARAHRRDARGRRPRPDHARHRRRELLAGVPPRSWKCCKATVEHVARARAGADRRRRVHDRAGVPLRRRRAEARRRRPDGAAGDGLQVRPRETMAHFRTVAKATDLPIMVYNNPPSYGVDITPEMFAELADEPKFVAHQGVVARTSAASPTSRTCCGDRYVLFCGVDDLVLESVMLGRGRLGVAGW